MSSARPALMCGALLDSQLLYAVAQCAKAHAEQLRCRGLVVAGLLQRLDDGVTLDGFELTAERCVAGHGGARRRSGGGLRGRGAARDAEADVLRDDDTAG